MALVDDGNLRLLRLSSSGGMDDTYGPGGVTLPFMSVTHPEELASVVAGDDSVLVSGGLATNATGATLGLKIVRIRTDGSVDTAFGSAGSTTIGVSVESAALATSPDGASIAAAFSVPDASSALSFASARLLPSGALDTSFGTGGIATPAVGVNAVADSVAIDPLGRVLVGGFAQDPKDSAWELVVVRYWP
jgi:uncharacterized delta-60 repeat protein